MNPSRINFAGRCVQAAWSAVVTAVMAILFSATALAQAPAAAGAPPPPAADDLTQLVGRIALYPDDLVAIILPAATSPLQIVQADRYLDKRKSDPKLPIDDKWDDPVKSLLNYPDIVKMMSNDLDWTSELGEAVVADQAAVLEAVQVFRRQAKAAGNLKSDAKQVVKQEKEVIIIEPADPQVIYVPQYNPSTVVVYSSVPVWGYYPTPYPVYYYPYAPGAAFAAGVVWGAAIGAAWSGNHYGWGGGNDININRNTNINVGSGNTINRGQGGQGGGSKWTSNKQPGQVSSSVGKTPSSNRAGDARGSGGARASSQPAGGAGAGGARASAQPAGGAGASRGGGGSSSFGGYDSGRQTQMDSSRGASSRNSASASTRSASGGGAGSRPTASSASRGGGGGASRGGGGGGRGGRR
ncbi:MAG: DUF3300 domain-containing protein [Burkholderiaceae bacterium]|jgi:hypothetical protein|nr:DUF3300 domain-containing protein [Burkholderiaceae bacterium]